MGEDKEPVMKMSEAFREQEKKQDEDTIEELFNNFNAKADKMKEDRENQYKAFGVIFGLVGLGFLHYHIYQSAAVAIFFVVLGGILVNPTRKKGKK